MESLNSMFVDSNEKQMAVLGGGYLKNFLSTGSFENGWCVCTNMRVYFRGKCYYKSGSDYKVSSEERTVDLKDITGTGLKAINNWVLKIAAIVMAVLSPILALIMGGWEQSLDNNGDGVVEVIMVFGCCGLVATGLLVFLYFILKIKVFEIAYAGGKIAFKAADYSVEEIQEFQKVLRIAKDQYINEHNRVSVNIQNENSYSKVTGSLADELTKYKKLLEDGVITQEEFSQIKQQLLK